MASDPNHFLNELPLWKLKAVADRYKIDVSGCRYKRDYIQRIASKNITEEMVRQVLLQLGKERGVEPERVREDIERIAQAPTTAPELPKEELQEIDKRIDEVLAARPSMLQVDSAAEAARSRMIVGDHYEAIRLNRDARLKCLDAFSRFQVYSAALSIRAADELLAKIAARDGDIDPILKTAVAEAKRAFMAGNPKRLEEAFEHLESLTVKAFDAFMANSEKEENELRKLLMEYESFGTRTEESRKYLDIAAEAKRSLNIGEYNQLLRSARNAAERAKDLRAREISATFNIVRAGIAEAKESGLAVSEAELRFQEAEKAFGAGSFREAVALLSAIEREVDSAHLEKIRSEKQEEDRRLEQMKAQLDRLAPVLREAASYGFMVQDGEILMANAQAALSARDVVNAGKYTRLVGEVVSRLLKDVIVKRIELGVAKRVEGAKCGKCGKETLYAHPDAVQRCSECGHSFAIEGATAQPPAEAVPPQAHPAVASADAQAAASQTVRKRRLLKK
ncbi:MAG: hypothetical protein QXJ32_02930 [Thermoplasmata archaeon]